MQTKRDFLKTGVALASTIALPEIVRAAPTTRWLTNNMSHYYEFNSSQNPNGYGWCGHTALKIAGKYVSGQDKTLTQIHNTFHANSAGYRANQYCIPGSGFNWCGSLQDLMWAARLSQNGGYGRSAIASTITTASSATDFFTKVKDSINNNWPVIAPSRWKYSDAGHFWVICGYTDWGQPSGSALYLRNVAISSPIQPNADENADVLQFYNLSAKQMLIMK